VTPLGTKWRTFDQLSRTLVSALRQRLGLTQKAFAAQLGVKITAYKRWETGKVRMTKPTWEMMFNKD